MGRESKKKTNSAGRNVTNITRAPTCSDICPGCGESFNRRGIAGHKKKCLGKTRTERDSNTRALAEAYKAIIKADLDQQSGQNLIGGSNSQDHYPDDNSEASSSAYPDQGPPPDDDGIGSSTENGANTLDGSPIQCDAPSIIGSENEYPLNNDEEIDEQADVNLEAKDLLRDLIEDSEEEEPIIEFDPSDLIHNEIPSHGPPRSEMNSSAAITRSLERAHPSLQEDDIIIEYHPNSGKASKHISISDAVNLDSASIRSSTTSRRAVPPSARGHAPAQSSADDNRPVNPDGTKKRKPWFPFSSELDFEIAEFALETHLNAKQKNRLLDIIQRAIKTPDDFTLENDKDLQTLWDLACRRTQGLEKTTGTAIYENEEISFDVWTRPIWDWVLELLGNKDIAQQCHWDAERQYKYDGKTLTRFWDEPWTGDAWWEIQSKLPEGAAPVCLLIYADKTRLSSFGTAQGYPVIARLLNLPIEMRNGTGIAGGRVVGWLPIVKEKSGEAKKPGYINLKRVIWHKAFYELLHAISQHSKTGYLFKCGDGLFRWLYPIILILSADYEEQTFMALIRGHRGLYPCPVCLVPQKDQSDLSKKYPLRTTSSMKAVYEEGQTLSPDEKEKLFKRHGLRDVENIFWMFDGTSDVYLAMTFDRLHAYHQGLFADHILKLTKRIFELKLDKKYSQQLDDQVDEIPSWNGLNHFSSIIKAATFSDGRKHEDMSKVLLYAAANILTPARLPEGYLMLKILRSYLELDMYASLSVHTEHTLDEGEAELLVFSSLVQEHRLKYGTKTWNFPKVHSHQHLFQDIRRKGVTRNANTKLGEKQHRAFKKFYLHHTNFKDTDKQILRLEHESLASLMIRRDINDYHTHNEYLRQLQEDYEEEIHPGARTINYGKSQHPNQQPRRHVGLDYITFGSPLSPISLRDIEQPQNEVLDVAFKDFRKRLSQALSKWQNRSVRLDAHVTISRYQYLKVSFQSVVSWQELTDILRVNPSFHGSPRYDCVLVKQPGDNSNVFFARLLSLFSVMIEGREWFIAHILPMDRTTSTANRNRDNDLRLTRVCSRPREKTAFIQADWIIRGALLAKDHGSTHTFDEFFVVKEVDDDLWTRMKSASLATQVVL